MEITRWLIKIGLKPGVYLGLSFRSSMIRKIILHGRANEYRRDPASSVRVPVGDKSRMIITFVSLYLCACNLMSRDQHSGGILSFCSTTIISAMLLRKNIIWCIVPFVRPVLGQPVFNPVNDFQPISGESLSFPVSLDALLNNRGFGKTPEDANFDGAGSMHFYLNSK